MESGQPSLHVKDAMQWYVMRVTYGRELAAKEALDYMPTEVFATFVPMRYEYVVRAGKKTRILKPSVRNLVFVRTSRAAMDDIKRTKIPYLRYLMCHDSGQSYPMTVRDEDMQNFMRVARRLEEDIQYVAPEDFNLKEGERVRIVGGPFVDAEGFLVKIKGCRSKRVVVSLDDFLHVATTVVPISLIEKIK